MDDKRTVELIKEKMSEALDSPLVHPILTNALRHSDSEKMAVFTKALVESAGFTLVHYEDEA
jgi:hypothetical protein